MLKISDIVTVPLGHLYVDEYIPLAFKSNDSTVSVPIRWRTGNLQNTMFEIKVDADNFQIYSASLILSPPVVEKVSNDIVDIQTMQGIPTIEATILNSKILDFPNEFKIRYKKKHIRIEFSSIFQPSLQIKNGRTTFYVKSDEIIGVGFSDFTTDEVNLLKKVWQDIKLEP
jgi:hypothetical protein